MRSALQYWLSLRIRFICVVVFIAASLLPPYVPSAALSQGEEARTGNAQFLFVEEGFLMKSSSLTEQGARLAFTEGLVHTVREGDSLEKLAQKYGISKPVS